MTNGKKNFRCDILKKGSKIPRNIISLCLKTDIEIFMILYMSSPTYTLYGLKRDFLSSGCCHLVVWIGISPSGPLFF